MVGLDAAAWSLLTSALRRRPARKRLVTLTCGVVAIHHRGVGELPVHAAHLLGHLTPPHGNIEGGVHELVKQLGL
ncbi:MAG: hypothetical protein JO287_10740 [Pseudonocardiales bacterium]|nr:hypothetical protein [Pseudonocardiales bacterium]